MFPVLLMFAMSCAACQASPHPRGRARLAMVAAAAQTAKRAFVKALLALAATAGVAAGVTRDSPDPEVLAAGRHVAESLRAAADGDADSPDEQRLDALRAAWQLARDAKGKAGRPPSRSADATASSAAGEDARAWDRDPTPSRAAYHICHGCFRAQVTS